MWLITFDNMYINMKSEGCYYSVPISDQYF